MISGDQLAGTPSQAPSQTQSLVESLQRRPRGRLLLQAVHVVHEALQPEIDIEAQERLERFRADVAYWKQEELAYKPLAELLEEIERNPRFEPRQYAKDRVERQNHTTLEIGPGNDPSGLNRRFDGENRYIGIDNFSFLDYAEGAERFFDRLKGARPTENIEFIVDEEFGCTDDPNDSRYNLPDEIADEAYVCRVYDKPVWGSERNGDELVMTKEIARILKPGGIVMIGDLHHNAFSILRYLHDADLELVFVSTRKNVDEQTCTFIHDGSHTALMQDLDFGYAAPLLMIARKPAK
jgi:hypothetical protein